VRFAAARRSLSASKQNLDSRSFRLPFARSLQMQKGQAAPLGRSRPASPDPPRFRERGFAFSGLMERTDQNLVA
jgi:hypothetical protein